MTKLHTQIILPVRKVLHTYFIKCPHTDCTKIMEIYEKEDCNEEELILEPQRIEISISGYKWHVSLRNKKLSYHHVVNINKRYRYENTQNHIVNKRNRETYENTENQHKLLDDPIIPLKKKRTISKNYLDFLPNELYHYSSAILSSIADKIPYSSDFDNIFIKKSLDFLKNESYYLRDRQRQKEMHFDEHVVLQESNIVLQESNIVLQESNIVLQKSNIVLQKTLPFGIPLIKNIDFDDPLIKNIDFDDPLIKNIDFETTLEKKSIDFETTLEKKSIDFETTLEKKSIDFCENDLNILEYHNILLDLDILQEASHSENMILQNAVPFEESNVVLPEISIKDDEFIKLVEKLLIETL
jgi:hypothetical protein